MEGSRLPQPRGRPLPLAVPRRTMLLRPTRMARVLCQPLAVALLAPGYVSLLVCLSVFITGLS